MTIQKISFVLFNSFLEKLKTKYVLLKRQYFTNSIFFNFLASNNNYLLVEQVIHGIYI